MASSSPRRRELLKGLGLPFKIVVSDADETVSANMLPHVVVTTLAERKARAVAASLPRSLAAPIIIAADTIVTIADRILGKPKDTGDAESMLRLLSGKTHIVYSGICVLDVPASRALVDYRATSVSMKQLTDRQIASYVATGEPMDKAGAYAIQGIGATLIEGIEGDYFSVVGLPLYLLSEMLLSFGVDVLTLGEGNSSRHSPGE